MTTQDHELSAALGWLGGISNPVLDRKVLLQKVAAMRLASQQALEAWDGDETNEWFKRCFTVMENLRAALAQQDEPVAWKQANLVTFNEDPCPVLGGLFVQFWDGEEVAARVYANDLKTLRQRCAKVNTAPPQRKWIGLTEAERIDIIDEEITAQNTEHFALAQAIEAKLKEKNT